MSTTERLLLTTKIQPPRMRTTLVARPQLLAQLDQAKLHQLTLISAPAGSGKTTLLSNWLAHCSMPFAWVALDADDNDPVRFLSYCIAALRTVFPQVGATAMALLQMQEALEPVLITFINELITLQQNDILLILDDYHLIHNQAIQHAMSFLLEHLPATLHLIIASRVDPPLPLARLRARGELNELHLSDLRFTSAETTSFCQKVMGLQLDPEQIATLEERTEGWIAGLQLAALSLRRRQSKAEITTFVRSFSGRDRHVLDYLLEEVLHQQPAHCQEFLLNTSLLERLSPALCAAVHNQQEAPLLEDLEHANLFLVPLDNERQWYRYHHLFAELLRMQLRQRYPERVSTLYQRAAEWYQQNAMPEEAVSNALAARNFEFAARIITAIAEDMLKRGEGTTVIGWLKQLPDGLVRSQPVLSVAYGLTLLATSQFEQAEHYLQTIEQDTQNQEGTRLAEMSYLKGRICAAKATIAINQDDYEAAIRLSLQARSLLPDEDLLAHGIITLNLGDAYKACGNFAEAERFLREAITLNQATGNILVKITAMSSLGRIQEQRGQLHVAEQTYQAALLLSSEQVAKGGQELPSTGKAHIFLSHLFYEWNRLEDALQQAKRGIELCQQWGHIHHQLDGYLILATIQQARSDYQAAHTTLTQAQTLIEQEQQATTKPNQVLNWMTWQVAEAYAHLWLHQGKLVQVEQWLQEQQLPSETNTLHPGTIILARLLLAQQKSERARSLLETLIHSAQQAGEVSLEYSLRAMLALALNAQGEDKAAIAQLAMVLERAEAENFVRAFVDLGPAMQALLRLASVQDNVTYYANRLLSAFVDTAHAETDTELTEQLSKREREILHLVATGMSNREIAQTLVMTVGTVKWYVNSIYGKLQVRGRFQAIERARTLGILRTP